MNEPSPYQSPQPQAPAVILPAMLGEPPVVKVMAILHLVFAGIGLLGAVWGLFIAFFGNPFLKLVATDPHLSHQLEAQVQMQQKIAPMSIASGILSILVAIPMIIAGIQMLKRRRNGLKWSNIYAFSSLGAKFVGFILALTILVPAMKEMTEGMMQGAHVPGGAKNMMSGFMAGGALGGVLVSCVYPILTLVLLNRPACKAWFNSRPN